MAESIYITRHEHNQVIKRLAYMEEYIKNSLREKNKPKWISPEEAMDMLGCRATKLRELRIAGKIDYAFTGNGRGVRIHRESVEKFLLENSTL